MNNYFNFKSYERKYSFVRYLKTLALYVSFSLFLYGCSDSQAPEDKEKDVMSNISLISESTIKELRTIQNIKIMFAHHSVGENILDGLQDIATEAGIDVNVVSINNAMSMEKHKFVDFKPGKNTQPETKIDGFVNKIQKLGTEYVPDIAFMKFCFIDFSPETDVDTLFTYYKNNIIALKKKRPEITFVHITVPLMTKPENIKTWIKRFFGQEVWIDASNVKRAKFNELLFKSFADDPIFDLAKIESTHLDGSREEFLYNGKTYYSLISKYTNDGSHLNKLGQRLVATKFIHFLANSLM